MNPTLSNQTDLTSDESTTIDMSDAAAIRKQLDGLESMYSEVLKLLGLRKHGRMGGPGGAVGAMGPSGFEGRRGRKGMYGSMSSLPSVSSIGSRHIYKVRNRKTTAIEAVKMVAG